MKKYMFLFILILSVFFTGFGDVNAATEPADEAYEVLDGYAACVYNGVYISDGDAYRQEVQVYLYAYREKNGSNRIWPRVYASDQFVFADADIEPKLNYVDLMSWGWNDSDYNNLVDTNKNFSRFYSNGKYKCPSGLYYYQPLLNWDSCPRNAAGSCLQLKLDNSLSKTSNDAGTLTVKSQGYDWIKNTELSQEAQGGRDDTISNDHGIIGAIMNWGKGNDETRYDKDSVDPCALISGGTLDLLQKVFMFISVAGIIILVVMTAISLIKVITASEDNALSNFLKGFWKRIICLIILLLLPTIITFLIQVVNGVGVAWNINSDNPLCDVTK